MTGPGENTYCRTCGLRAAPGRRTCANCGAALPATPNTIRTDAMKREPRGGVAPAVVLAGFGLALAVPVAALFLTRRGRR